MISCQQVQIYKSTFQSLVLLDVQRNSLTENKWIIIKEILSFKVLNYFKFEFYPSFSLIQNCEYHFVTLMSWCCYQWNNIIKQECNEKIYKNTCWPYEFLSFISWFNCKINDKVLIECWSDKGCCKRSSHEQIHFADFNWQ